MDGTIIQQGRFTSAGEAVELQIRSDIDWMSTVNYTIAGAGQTSGIGVEFYWQRGMSPDTGIMQQKSDATNASNLIKALTTGGFTLLDTSGSPLGTLNSTITAISTDSPPVVTNSEVNGLSAGDVVRLINVTGAQQLGGYDFTVGNGTLTDTTFSLDAGPTIAAATTGSWRKINFQSQFYPRHRFISYISKAVNAIVTMTVQHDFTIGQEIRLKVPAAFGMDEANDILATVIGIPDPSMITLDLDTTSYSSFAFPVSADVPFTPALVVPVGESASSSYANLLDDATKNSSFIGMKLAAGTFSPAGATGDVIYWRAGKSFSVSNS